jgi:hypothetical protein
MLVSLVCALVTLAAAQRRRLLGEAARNLP